jgi:hypothetical protein
MAFQIVYWNSLQKTCCATPFPASVVVCLDPARVAQKTCIDGGQTNFPWATIDAQLMDMYIVTNDCLRGPVYRYTVRYDDAQLVGDVLQSSEIQGILCVGCLTNFIYSVAGNEVTMTQEEDGAIVFTSQHGCTFTFSVSGVIAQDTPSIDLTLTGFDLTADLNLSSCTGNKATIEADGLCVPPDFIDSIIDTTSIDLNVSPSATLSAGLIVSALADNILSVQPDGVYVPVGAGITVNDTSSVDLTLAVGVLSADVEISVFPGNQVSILGDGLYVPTAPGLSVLDTASVDLTLLLGVLSADVEISAFPGNQVVILGDGLFVPAGLFTVSDTASVDLTLLAGVLSADVEISAGAGNQVSIAGDGLFVPLAAGLSVLDTASVDLTLAAGVLSADVEISAGAGNQVSIAGDGLFVPTPAVVSVLDTTSSILLSQQACSRLMSRFPQAQAIRSPLLVTDFSFLLLLA